MKVKDIIYSLLIISLFKEFHANQLIQKQALEYGINLTDPNDPFFHDICLLFTEIKKDITLEYRRKYFYFPLNTYEQNYTNLIYQNPIRNNSNDCFFLNGINGVYNYGFIFITLFFFQMFLLGIVMFCKIMDFTYNSPIRKRIIQQLNKKTIKIGNNTIQTYTQFVSEETKDTKKVDVNKKLADLIKDDTNNKKEQLDLISSSKLKLNNVKYNEEDFKDLVNSIINNNNSINPLNEDNHENIKPIEKSEDFYTFGQNTKFNFSNNLNDIKEKEIKKESKEDTLKKTRYIFNQINKDKKIPKKSNDIMNTDTPIVTQKDNEIFYLREEYFYIGYSLASIEDKRNFKQIYLDLLEQCQFLFKFIFTKFNIYEDRKLQLLYYSIKINFYFLFNCKIINTSVINDIYDNKNRFINDFYRSFIATILTYIIGLFFYYLINVKRIMIERRHNLLKMNIYDIRLGNEMVNYSLNFCLSFLYNKLILFSFLYISTFVYSAYVCYSFCSAYYFTQVIVMKCLLLSIAISFATPFVACCIPAFLRLFVIRKKKEKLYFLLKLIEILFIP